MVFKKINNQFIHYNKELNLETSDNPLENQISMGKNSDWFAIYDRNENRFYYFNNKTNKTQWEVPF